MPNHPPVPKAPQPTREVFDPYNSTSTGHQHVASVLAGTTSWRDSRSHKLAQQFRDASGRGGSKHFADLVGAGSENWGKDGRRGNGSWEKGAPGLREQQGCLDIRDLMLGNQKRASNASEKKPTMIKRQRTEHIVDSALVDSKTFSLTLPVETRASHTTTIANNADKSTKPIDEPVQIFRGLTFYLNGSTAPYVSDHKLKQMFMQHGGNTSIALGRRIVTHVILGKSCGGGLASSKIHKEVTTVGRKGIKYVTAQWVLDSVAKGIRQPEGQYMPPEIARRIGGSKQTSVRAMFAGKTNACKIG